MGKHDNNRCRIEEERATVRITCSENFVNFGRVVFEIGFYMSGQTVIQTRSSPILGTPPFRGRSEVMNVSLTTTNKMTLHGTTSEMKFLAAKSYFSG